MAATHGRERVSVRLVPQVPIRNRVDPVAWLGGGARLPPGQAWPESGGELMQLLVQLQCSHLPDEIWDGLGPRTGWLAIFLAPKSFNVLGLHFAEAGPLQPAPAILPDSNMIGVDFRGGIEKHLRVPAFPRWPADIISIRDKDVATQSRRRDDLRRQRYHQRWDVSEPRFHPFDWPSAQAMMNLALRRFEIAVPDPGIPATSGGRRADLERRVREAEETGAAEDMLLQLKLERDEAIASQTINEYAKLEGPHILARLRRLKEAVDAKALSASFSPDFVAQMLSEMHSMEWLYLIYPPQYRDGRKLSAMERYQEGVEILRMPLTGHSPAVFGWPNEYVDCLWDRAKHQYAKNPESLNGPLRRDCEDIWSDITKHEWVRMGHVPMGDVHEFSNRQEVVLLELGSSHLLNWMFSDVNNLVLTIKKTDLIQGDFSAIQWQVSHG